MYLWQQVKSQKLAPSPQASTNLQGKKICMSGLDTAHWQFFNTPKENFFWSNKYDTHNSIINKIRLEQRTWRRFYINKSNQLNQKFWTPNRHPHHDRSQTCGGSKSVCPVWIWPTDNFLTHTRTSFKINECWSGQCKQTSQQKQCKYDNKNSK